VASRLALPLTCYFPYFMLLYVCFIFYNMYSSLFYERMVCCNVYFPRASHYVGMDCLRLNFALR